MAANQCYADGYYTSFANEVDFLDFIKERRRNAEWKRMKANSVKVKAINEIQTDLTIRPSVWEDTLKNTRLVLETEESFVISDFVIIKNYSIFFRKLQGTKMCTFCLDCIAKK